MNPPAAIERQELEYVGRMTASAGHEIKNILAIINEQAGLLGDMAAVDDPAGLNPARLRKLSQDLARQVQRADILMKNLHRLAHSIQLADASVDLGELVTLVCGLGERLAYVQGRRIQMMLPATPITLGSDPLLLETLLWTCLEHALPAAAGEEIRLSVEPTAQGAEIRLAPLEAADTRDRPMRMQQLADALGIRLSLTPTELRLSLPRAAVVRQT